MTKAKKDRLQRARLRKLCHEGVLSPAMGTRQAVRPVAQGAHEMTPLEHFRFGGLRLARKTSSYGAAKHDHNDGR